MLYRNKAIMAINRFISTFQDNLSVAIVHVSIIHTRCCARAIQTVSKPLMSTGYVTNYFISPFRNKCIYSSFHTILSYLIIYFDTLALMRLVIGRIALENI